MASPTTLLQTQLKSLWRDSKFESQRLEGALILMLLRHAPIQISRNHRLLGQHAVNAYFGSLLFVMWNRQVEAIQFGDENCRFGAK